MPPPINTRPENVLKRAQELIGVGQQQAALSILHEHVSSKRTRNVPIASLEPVMLLFIDLCVEQRKGKLAKDGLYQYKNTAQNTNVSTIELVFRRLIELAEEKVTEAQAKADEVQSTQTQGATSDNVEDLEASETPESILLSTVSGEQSRDRTDRAIVTPWLKFLWEVYRMVLDIFKNNARLEIMYQTTAHQAFQFCSKYARKTEFRRLCELLRNHLQNAAKFSSQMHAINLSDPETLQRHLDTRFEQLNVAVELELWQEAFRSVEDIHTLLSLSKRPPKPIMMANYFEKLTRIFMVGDNFLFHAAAWSKYFNILRGSAAAMSIAGASKKDHPAVSESDMTSAASFVLLSALAIPVISTSRSRGALVDADAARTNKNARLTNLLRMNTAPTRAVLLKDALNKGLLQRCRSEIRELYNILEVEFHPLSICKRISPILSQIGSDPELQKYVQPLQQVILTRLFQQLSQVYESVQLDFVLSLAQFPDPYQVSKATIEKFIMNGCKKGDLAIRMDHASGVLTFDADVFSSAKALHPGSAAGSAEAETGSVQKLQSTPAEIVRSQLTRLAKALYITCQYVDPTFNEDRVKNRQAALQRAEAGAEKEHLETLARREVIDKKKQAASTAIAQKEKDLATEKRIRAQQAQAAEVQRLRDEQAERDRKRLEAEKLRVQQEEAQRALEELKRGTKGIDVSELDINSLDSAGIRAIKIKALEKEKNDLTEKLRQTARRIDHLERAYRMEEVKHLVTDYDEQRKRDQKAYDDAKKTTLEEAEAKHKDAVALKHRLSRFVGMYEQFKDDVTRQRKGEFEKRQKKAQQELNEKMDARRKEVRERRAREQREREEEERRRREEEERVEREAEEKARADEERRTRMAEEKERREAERKKLDEVAERQRQREAEAEAKLAQRRQGGAAAPPSRGPAAPERSSTPVAAGGAGGPPKLNLQRAGGGAGPSWREREAAKAAGNVSAATERAVDASAPNPRDATPATREAPPARTSTPGDRDGPAPRQGGYVPPNRRGGEEGGAAPGGGWREREGSNRGPPPSARDGVRGEPIEKRGGYVPPHLRGGADRARPGASTAEPVQAGEGGPSGPPPKGEATSDGKYRPGAFKRRE